LLPLEASATDLRPCRPGLLAAALAVALFAVSLSFVIFQLSPYRSLIPGASGRYVASAIAVLAMALGPVVALTSSPNASAHVSIAVLPALLLSSVLLVGLAQRGALADVLLSRLVSKLAVRARCFALVRPLREAEAELRAIAESSRDIGGRRIPPPMHEIFNRILPPPHRVRLAGGAPSRNSGRALTQRAGLP
jgi:hypothetical protein